MKKILSIIAIVQLVLISTSCTKYDQRLELSDLKKPQVFVLQKKSNQKNVHSMGVHCYGRIDGEARLVLMLNETPYKTEHMTGKVNFKWGGNWYTDSMELRYQPININSGQLIAEYIFHDL